MDRSSSPILIRETVIDPGSGRILGKIPGLPQHQPAVLFDSSRNFYTVDDVIVDPAQGEAIGKTAPELILSNNKVIRHTPEGKPLWQVEFDASVENYREPGFVLSSDRVIVAKGRDLVALDWKTGEILWTSPGPNARLLNAFGFVWAVDCTSGILQGGRWLVARHLLDGEEAFKVRIPDQTDPVPIQLLRDHLMLRGSARSDEEPFTWIVNQRGVVILRFDFCIGEVSETSDGWILVGPSMIVRCTFRGEKVWATSYSGYLEFEAGRISNLPNGDILVYSFCPISDSGVQVWRVDPANGRILWHARCEGIKADHSKYWHYVYVRSWSNRIAVISQGAFGSFLELLDLEGGRSINRWTY